MPIVFLLQGAKNTYFARSALFGPKSFVLALVCPLAPFQMQGRGNFFLQTAVQVLWVPTLARGPLYFLVGPYLLPYRYYY